MYRNWEETWNGAFLFSMSAWLHKVYKKNLKDVLQLLIGVHLRVAISAL